MTVALGRHRRICRAEACDRMALEQEELSPELVPYGTAELSCRGLLMRLQEFLLRFFRCESRQEPLLRQRPSCCSERREGTARTSPWSMLQAATCGSAGSPPLPISTAGKYISLLTRLKSHPGDTNSSETKLPCFHCSYK